MSQDKSSGSSAVPATKRYWISALILVLGFSLFAYYRHAEEQDSVVSQDYYRVLYEASNHFNENLIKLTSLYQYEAGVSTLRSLFPSFRRRETPLAYSRIKNLKADVNAQYTQQTAPAERTEFRLSHHELLISSAQFTDKIQMEDILPVPAQGFSQYLFADANGIVLTSSGDEKSISVVDLTSVKLALHQQKTKWRMDQQSTQDGAKLSLPSLSRHIDMTLSHGEYRVFLYPFRLETALMTSTSAAISDGNLQDVRELHSFYLVGLLPKEQLSNKESGVWNLSILLISLVSLVFVWFMLRLLLMPRHQSIGRIYRNTFYCISYALFVLVAAFLLASLEHRQLADFKAQIASEYARQIASELEQDLQDVFSELEQYKTFYRYLVTHFLPLEKTLRQDCQSENEQTRPDFCAPDIRDLTFYGITANARWLMPQQQQFKPYIYEYISPDSKLMDIYHQNLSINAEQDSLTMSLTQPTHAGKFKSIFTINPDARLTLPSIYFYENGASSIYDLSHRDYFKQARDMRGYRLPRANNLGNFEHIYIQRLLNIDNGTRGTSVSMPLFDNNRNGDNIEGRDGFVLGADILLPSVSLRAPHPQDLVFLVVNRQRGQVLFHTDNDRTLTENIFHVGGKTSAIDRWLKAGMDNKGQPKDQLFSGHYHGQSGRFAVHPAPIDAWAVLVFYPDSSLKAHQFSGFLFYALTLGGMLLLTWLVLQFMRISNLSASLQNVIPCALHSVHGMLLISLAVYLSTAVWVITGVILFPQADQTSQLTGLIIISALVCIGLGILYPSRNHNTPPANGKWLVITGIFVFSIAQSLYLSAASSLPLSSLMHYYQNYQCAAWNQEQRERHKIALNNYPNSITHKRFDPQSLLPAAPQSRGPCDTFLQSVTTEDYPPLTTLASVRYSWQWLKILLNQEHTEPSGAHFNNLRASAVQPWGPIILYILLIAMLPIIWWLFNRNLLWQRLDYSSSYLGHLNRMMREHHNGPIARLHPHLIIHIAAPKHNGIHLSLLLAMTTGKDNDEMTCRFRELINLCPQLMACQANSQHFSNLKINLKRVQESGKLHVELWDIESSLEQAQQRQCLLELIMQLKSLVLLGKIHGLKILTEFHTLNRIRQKNHFSAQNSNTIQSTEYLSWAECLMDFRLIPPQTLSRNLDNLTLEREIADFPGLEAYLNGERFDASDTTASSEGSREQTIKLILILADALYRFKWESCSDVEKLALYNLAKGDHLNPLNRQMIEQLLLDGLIKVTDTDIHIANLSFTRFILNAEPKTTIAALIHQGEAGAWKSYRVPLGLLIVIIIAGMALTSGQSIPIIIASVAGIMGTLASLANSANLLRGQLKG